MKTKEIDRLRKVAKNNTLSYLNDVGFVSGGFITATNLDVFLILPTDIEGEGKVYLSELRNVKYDRAEIIDGFLVFTNGKNKSKIALPTDGDFPEVPAASKILGELEPADVDHLKNAVKFAAKDKLRPVMAGVYVDEDRITATDAWRMIWHKKQGDAAVQDIIIRKEVIDVLKNGKEYQTRITVGLSEPNKSQNALYYIFQTNTDRIVFRAIDGKYPNYRAVIPRGQEFKATFDTAELISGVEAALPFAHKETKMGVFAFLPEVIASKGRKQTRRVVLCSLDLEWQKEFSFTMEVSHNITDEPFFIGLNLQFLKEILDKSEPLTTFEMSEPNRAIIINDNRLLMPLLTKSEIIDRIKQELTSTPEPEAPAQPEEESTIEAEAEIGEISEQPEAEPENISPLFQEAKEVFERMVQNATPEELRERILGYGIDAALFAKRFVSPDTDHALYKQIYMLYFDFFKTLEAVSPEETQPGAPVCEDETPNPLGSGQAPEPETSTPEPVCEDEAPAPAPEETGEPAVKIILYSEKGFAVVGDVEPIRELLIENYGSYKKHIAFEGQKYGGYVFSRKRLDKITELINQ